MSHFIGGNVSDLAHWKQPAKKLTELKRLLNFLVKLKNIYEH